MKKYGYILFTAAFLIICLVPSLGMIFLGPSKAAGNEVLAPAPRATWTCSRTRPTGFPTILLSGRSW